MAEQHLAEQHLAAEERQAEEVLAAVGAVRALDEVQGRIASYFHRREMRERVRRYLEGLLTPVERKNSWQLAEGLGEAGPQRGPRPFSPPHLEAEVLSHRPCTAVVGNPAHHSHRGVVIVSTRVATQ